MSKFVRSDLKICTVSVSRIFLMVIVGRTISGLAIPR